MNLQLLKLSNFKGIKSFEFSPKGANVEVFGANATGKSTIKDAVSWLLFNKSADDKKMIPKTIDKDGHEIHMLEHIAEGWFLTDGENVKLKKMFSEKYPKKRGSNVETFTGHKTKYWVDDVPVKQKEYTAIADKIASVETFKLLSDVNYFSGKMSWQKRRDLVLEVCGDISDKEVIATDKNLSGLPALLGTHSVEDFVKILKASMKEINDSIQGIPARVDEVHLSKMETTGTVGDAIKMAEATSKLVDRAKADVERLKSPKALIKKENNLVQLNIDHERIQLDIDKATKVVEDGIDQKVDEHQAVLDEFDPRITKLSGAYVALQNELSRLKQQKDNLYGEFSSINAMAFDKESLVCPTCNKPSTKEEADGIIKKFNEGKSSKLSDINARGKGTNTGIEETETAMNVNANKRQEMADKCLPSEQAIKSLTEKKANIPPDKKLSGLLEDKHTAIKKLVKEIDAINDGSTDELEIVEGALKTLQDELESAQKSVIYFETNIKAEDRIKELGDEEKNLSGKYEELEGQLFLTETFTRAKVGAMEGKIADHFKFARFKMFDNLINGGLAEVCEVTMDGIPYNNGLNNGARINVGLDIINTLSKHYGVNVPILIDNAESVSDTIDTDSQVIKLIVSGKDKTLRVK